MDIKCKEEREIAEAIVAARKMQEVLWGEYNGKWNIEEWRRMFRKHIQKIDDIDPDNPHAKVEMRKRLIQNAALSIALLHIINESGIPTEKCNIPSNLPQYSEPIKS